jgi:hypothetical protein
MELSIFVEGLFQMSDYRIHFKFRLHGRFEYTILSVARNLSRTIR